MANLSVTVRLTADDVLGASTMAGCIDEGLLIPIPDDLMVDAPLPQHNAPGDNSWQQLTPEQSHAYAAAWQQQQQQGFVDPSFMQQVAYYSHQWSAGGYGVSGAAGGATAAAGAGQAVAQVSTHNQQYTVPADGYSPYNTNTGGPTAAPATTTYTPSGHVQEQVPFSGYTTMQQTQFAGLQCAGPNFISMQHQQYSAGQAAAWHEAYSMQQPHSGPQYNQPHASDHPQLYSHQAAAAAARQSRFPATDASPFLYEQQRQQQKSAKKKKARQQFSNTKSASAGRKQQQQQQNPLAAMCSVPEAEGGAGVPESSAQTVPRPSQTENNCQQEQQQRPMTLLEKAGSTIALAFPKQGDAPTAADSVTPQLVLPAAPQEQEAAPQVTDKKTGAEEVQETSKRQPGQATLDETPTLRHTHEVVTTVSGWGCRST